MNRKVCLYARVSTDQQSTGLEAQVRALKEYCSLNKLTEYELFTDEGISGTKSSRPALDRMMNAVKNGEVECVVVYSFSRFARSTTHMLHGMEVMKAHNANFCSITERVDTNSPIGKAMFVIISAIAQLERDLIADVIKKCRCSRLKQSGARVNLFLPRKKFNHRRTSAWKIILDSMLIVKHVLSSP